MVVGDDIGGTGAGAATSIYLTDACVLAKAYITAGVASGVGIGQGPGPVVHTAFPSQKEYFPSIVVNPQSDESEGFLKMQRTTTLASKEGLVLGKLLPIVDLIFPYVDIVTPNKFEAEELLGRSLNSFHDIERGAKEILDMGVKSVLIKGGHVFSEDISSVSKRTDDKYAQDYFLSQEPPLDKDGKERICDG
jgi:hydroxymethylpyrimidine/phosphomethylpyrimidine kinase